MPVRELIIENCDDDLSIFKTAVNLLLKDHILFS